MVRLFTRRPTGAAWPSAAAPISTVLHAIPRTSKEPRLPRRITVLVYAVGRLGHNFESQARRNGSPNRWCGGDPDDPRQAAAYLKPSASASSVVLQPSHA